MLSADQLATVGVMFRNILNPICCSVILSPFDSRLGSAVKGFGRNVRYLGDCFRRVSEITASLKSGFGEEVLDQAHAYVIAHFVKLLVDFGIFVVKIRAQLSNHGAVSQGHKLRIDLVDVGPRVSQDMPAEIGVDLERRQGFLPTSIFCSRHQPKIYHHPMITYFSPSLADLFDAMAFDEFATQLHSSQLIMSLTQNTSRRPRMIVEELA